MNTNPRKPRIGVVLAAGIGARLDRHDTPKPLVKVGRIPLIVRNIEQLQDFGVSKIYVVIGYRGEEIRKELTGNPAITATVEYIEERDFTKRGMSRSISRLPGLIPESFWLCMADLVIEKNPYEIMWKKIVSRPGSKKSASDIHALIDIRTETMSTSGALSRVALSRGSIVRVGTDIASFEGVEVGVYYFGANSQRLMERAVGKDAVPASFGVLLTKLAAAKCLHAVSLPTGAWFDVNTPSTYIRAEMFARDALTPKRLVVGNVVLKRRKPAARFVRRKVLVTDVVIESGILGRLSQVEVIPPAHARATHYLITDETVDALHGKKVHEGLRAAGFDVRKLVVPAGEKTKSIAMYSRLADEIFAQGIDKMSIIMSLGGGVVNNIAGFLASTLYRGIGLIHIPTTTMAQVDAAIDFKQAVNSTKGKNLLGSYHPAMSIIIDPDVVRTLDMRHVRNGFSESIKHALAQDRKFFEYLLEHESHQARTDVVEEITRRTIDLKVPLLCGDTKDDYNEMIPQYGHSIGHAIEHLSGYELLHGEAIAVGMCVSAEIALLLGISDRETVEDHYRIFSAYRLPTSIPHSMSEDDVIATMRYDKHHVERPFMSLVERVGSMFHKGSTYGVPIDYEIVRRAIRINKEKSYETTASRTKKPGRVSRKVR